MDNEYILQIEKQYKSFTGTDEVGRGCIAGPVVAAAVTLNENNIPPGIKDSKQLSHKQRIFLYKQIIESTDDYFICVVDVEEIDLINILNASKKAMSTACSNLKKDPSTILVDGIHKPEQSKNYICIPQGDKKSIAIGAASILAKVFRDNIMLELHKKYDYYDWCNNKGYGTKKHIEQIIKHGISPHHRKSFEPIKSIINNLVLF